MKRWGEMMLDGSDAGDDDKENHENFSWRRYGTYLPTNMSSLALESGYVGSWWDPPLNSNSSLRCI